MKIFTEEHRRHLSESRKGIKFSEEHRNNLSKAFTGIKQSPERVEARASKIRGIKRRSLTEEERLKISIGRKGKGTGKRKALSEEHKRKLREAKIGYVPWNKNKKGEYHLNNINKVMPRGPQHYMWKEDRTKIQDPSERKTPEYRNWRKKVFERDHFSCRLGDENCVKEIEAHHIIPYRENINLRHKVENGITLCKFHHPHGEVNEKSLAPLLQEIVKNIK